MSTESPFENARGVDIGQIRQQRRMLVANLDDVIDSKRAADRPTAAAHRRSSSAHLPSLSRRAGPTPSAS